MSVKQRTTIIVTPVKRVTLAGQRKPINGYRATSGDRRARPETENCPGATTQSRRRGLGPCTDRLASPSPRHARRSIEHRLSITSPDIWSLPPLVLLRRRQRPGIII